MTTTARHTPEQVETWRREGALVLRDVFTPEEVLAVRRDFETVWGGEPVAAEPLVRRRPDGPARFHPSQFRTLDSIPLDCSPALNLAGLHPALIAYAKACLGSEDVHLYQCQAWSKQTGASDYEQPFHCDYVNHTLTAPAEDPGLNALTMICLFTDVDEGHGPTHYVTRSDSRDLAGPEATLTADPQLQAGLAARAKSAASPAGSVFAYGVDVWHRGTNLTAPRGVRHTVTACYRQAGNDAVAFTAWPFHHLKPWSRIFDHADPEQLACLGVPRPGAPFWTEVTLRRTRERYPGWNHRPYAEALGS